MFVDQHNLAVALDAEGRVLDASNEPADGIHTFPFVFTYFPGESGLGHMRALFPNAVEVRRVTLIYNVEGLEGEQ
jgi:hypothetical protein